jgi:hypothetical protein
METQSIAARSALTIWDIDDTLFRTHAKILVKNQDHIVRELSGSEFNRYSLGPNEHFDFVQFDCARLFFDTSQPISNLWKTAKNTLKNIEKRPGSKMVIVTARRDLNNKDLFLETFKKHGMDITKVHVYRAGNLPFGSSAKNKQHVIRSLLANGKYSETRLFDDHYPNLEAFLDLKSEFSSITFKAFLVMLNGEIKQPIIV